MPHVLASHTNCEDQYCPICVGGLASCTVCNGAEGSLPTYCPGRPMTGTEMGLVAAGKLDFINGAWLVWHWFRWVPVDNIEKFLEYHNDK